MKQTVFFLGLFLHSIYSFCQYTGANQIINNGDMRFGDGVELSINTSGNFKQPFYLNIGSTWSQLTYTDGLLAVPIAPNPYPLDSKFGVGGDGTNTWNTTGDLQPNPIMAGQVFDSSGFSGGSGILNVKGTITVGTAQLELINSYSISSGDNFVEVLTNKYFDDANNSISITRGISIRYSIQSLKLIFSFDLPNHLTMSTEFDKNFSK